MRAWQTAHRQWCCGPVWLGVVPPSVNLGKSLRTLLAAWSASLWVHDAAGATAVHDTCAYRTYPKCSCTVYHCHYTCVPLCPAMSTLSLTVVHVNLTTHNATGSNACTNAPATNPRRTTHTTNCETPPWVLSNHMYAHSCSVNHKLYNPTLTAVLCTWPNVFLCHSTCKHKNQKYADANTCPPGVKRRPDA